MIVLDADALIVTVDSVARDGRDDRRIDAIEMIGQLDVAPEIGIGR